MYNASCFLIRNVTNDGNLIMLISIFVPHNKWFFRTISQGVRAAETVKIQYADDMLIFGQCEIGHATIVK